MKKVSAGFFILLFPVLCFPSILKIEVNDPIHPVTSEYIRNSIDKASQENAQLLIITLNTPGGLDSSMREIIEKILGSPVPIAAFVYPNGARAASAGFFIAIACDIFAMAPGTNTGAAHPVGVSITGSSMDKTMEEKVTHDAASYIKTIAEKRGKNPILAEKAVRESVSYTEQEAMEGRLIDLIAKDVTDLVEKLHNKSIRRIDKSEVSLDLKGESIIPVQMTARQKFLLTISNPNLAYILLMIGLLGLYFEFANPGAILPGVLGGISLLLAIFSFQILPINYVGLLLILLAIVLFILEIKVQSYGILSIGGVIAMVLGSTMLINSAIPELRPSLKFIIPVALAISLVFVFLIYLVIKTHAGRISTGKEGLIGEIGTVQNDLTPEGKVFVYGEIWNAEATENIPKGTKIKVIEVLDNMKLKVTRSK
ncbi:MAG: NfeD family protein [Candidatus Aminicenantaceae bacterium]